MEEKKQMKISLGTAICIFLIIILTIALVVMYLYYNKSKENLGDQIVTSEAMDKTTNNNSNSENNKEELLSDKAFKEENTVILLPINKTIEKLTNNLKGTTWNSKTAYIKDVNGNVEETTLYTVLGTSFGSVGESYLKLNADGTYYNAIFPIVENEKGRNGTWKVLAIDEAPNEDDMTTIEIALSSGECISIRYTKDLEIKQLDYGVKDGQIYSSKIVLEKE